MSRYSVLTSVGEYLGENLAELEMSSAGASRMASISLSLNRRSSSASGCTAAALVCRPLDLPRGVQNAAVENYEGLSIRVVYGYDMDRKEDRISIDCLYGVKVLAELAETAAVSTADSGRQAEVSFGTDYAAVQHEDLTLEHPGGGQAKFLETAASAEQASMLRAAAGSLRRLQARMITPPTLTVSGRQRRGRVRGIRLRHHGAGD
jgi:hypothetical protein